MNVAFSSGPLVCASTHLPSCATLSPHPPECAENFTKFLSEEWDLATFVDFLTAQNMMIQVLGNTGAGDAERKPQMAQNLATKFNNAEGSGCDT